MVPAAIQVAVGGPGYFAVGFDCQRVPAPLLPKRFPGATAISAAAAAKPLPAAAGASTDDPRTGDGQRGAAGGPTW